MKRSLTGVVALLAGLALAVPGIATAAPTPDPSTAVPTSTHRVRVLVTFDQQPTSASLTQEATLKGEQSRKLSTWKKKYGVDVRRQFGYLVNGLSATMPENSIAQLAAQPGVRSVTRAQTFTTTDTVSDDLTQDLAARVDQGVDGTGTVVAIVDTGIDASHRDMQLSAAGAEGAKIKNVKEGKQFSLKVPYGHNFADDNDDIVDTTGSEHGMHVSGIVAANDGTPNVVESNKRVTGAAPEAQLLAMKVFSNDPENSQYAYDDDIIAAIEDSVKHKADVINMSLGSPNGFTGSQYGIQKAIATATGAGVLVVVSAGNAGLRSSLTGETDDYYGRLDDGTVGGPSTAQEALSVASVEGATVVQQAGNAFFGPSTSPDLTFPYSHQAGPLVTTATPLAEGGFGTPAELTGVAGKIAFIQRGTNTFAEKISNALSAGASGVIVWNHAAGGDAFVSMAGTEGVTRFVGFLGHTDGQKIEDQLAAGVPVAATFTSDPLLVPNDAVLTPSTFTSWGTTPSLDFKPNLAGIGGNVYSTLNADTYGTMSGTSMAAPNVAGAAALMIEKSNEARPKVKAVDAISRVRTALSNTAEILTDSTSVPFAPRQVGAGLIQTQDALSTEVLATVDGSADVALRQVAAPRRVTVTLRNSASTPRTYATGSLVVNESNAFGASIRTSVPTDESATASTPTVTVPARGSATVTYTITPATSRSAHYLEGWLTLDSTDAREPDLSVPFLGFVGDWNAEPIVDPTITSPDSLMQYLFEDGFTGTQMITQYGDEAFQAGDPAWFSPNGDQAADVVYPALTLLRGATGLSFTVLDRTGRVVADLGGLTEVPPNLLADILAGTDLGMYLLPEATFDGTSAGSVLPDGTYTYRVTSTLAAGYAPQVLDLPVGIDTVAPVISLTSAEASEGDVVLTLTFADSGSGWGGAVATHGADGLVKGVTKDAGSFTVTIPGAAADPGAVGPIAVTAFDAAGNAVGVEVTLAVVDPAAAKSGSQSGPQSGKQSGGAAPTAEPGLEAAVAPLRVSGAPARGLVPAGREEVSAPAAPTPTGTTPASAGPLRLIESLSGALEESVPATSTAVR